jgi:hypothetical protein
VALATTSQRPHKSFLISRSFGRLDQSFSDSIRLLHRRNRLMPTMRRSLRRGACCAVLAGIAAFAVAGQAPDAPRLTPQAGIVQLIGVAQAIYFHSHGRYAMTLGDLLDSGQLELAAVRSADNLLAFHRLDQQPGHNPVPGFQLQLTVPPDGASFQVSLADKTQPCADLWFADQRGKLYSGKPIGCKSEEVAAAPALPPAPAPAMPPPDVPKHEPVAAPPRVSPPAHPQPRNWGPPDIDQVVPPVNADKTCPLPQILKGVSERALELVENLQRFTASERIDHREIGKKGNVRNSQSRVVNYTAQIEHNWSGSLRVEEYRSSPRSDLPQAPLADTGTAAFALIFHPRHIGNFDIRCEGFTDVGRIPAWQLHFEETADPTKSFHAIQIGGSVYQLRFKGRAWVAAGSYEVLRLETDLVSPIPEIQLQVEHLDITYAPVEFRKRNLKLWLPENATLYIGFQGRRYERIHHFSRYELFWVDTGQTVKEPPAGPGAPTN